MDKLYKQTGLFFIIHKVDLPDHQHHQQGQEHR